MVIGHDSEDEEWKISDDVYKSMFLGETESSYYDLVDGKLVEPEVV